MTVKVAWFSTDFSTEKIPDPIKSARNGRQEFVEGQQRISFGGTYLQRGAMPAMELTKHGYESIICWRFQQDDDGNIHVLDMHGQWRHFLVTEMDGTRRPGANAPCSCRWNPDGQRS